MSVIDTLVALAITVRNEKKKEANSAIRIGDLFLAIIDFIKGVQSGEIRQDGVDTYNDTSEGKTSLLNKYPNPELNWTVLVRKDETNGGKASLYKWNGSKWINLETVVYNDDIATHQDLSQLESSLTTDIRSAIDIQYSANLFNKYAIVQGYYGTDGITFQESNMYWTSDYIPVVAGNKYKRIGSGASMYTYAYNFEKKPVVVDGTKVYWTSNFESTDIPENVAFVRVIFPPEKIAECMFTLSDIDTSFYIPFTLSKLRSESLPIIHPFNCSFFEYTENVFNQNSILKGYYGTNGVVFQPSDIYWSSDFIAVEAGKRYKRVNNGSLSYFVYAYDTNKTPIAVDGTKVYWQNTFENTDIPENVAFVKVLFSPDSLPLFMFVLSDVNTSEYIPYLQINPSFIPSSVIDTSRTDTYGKSYLGNSSFPNILLYDYVLEWMYSQSLGMGWEATRALTTIPIPGNFMWGNNVLTKYNTGTGLNPLVANVWTNGGEQPIVSSVNVFSQLWRRYMNPKQQFIAMSGGQGGQSIEKLSKNCTNGTTQENNLYYTTFLNPMQTVKNAVGAEGKTICCASIAFMQGEYNYTSLAGGGLTNGTDATDDKDTYKAYWLQWKNDAQADVMSILGQTEKPLILIYQVAGSYIERVDMSINMALLEIAQENDDVILMNPTYFTPDYNGGHLSPNGTRMYGESIGKAKYDVFVRGERFMPVHPENITISGNKIMIDHYVPVPPLVFDTWTKESIANYGYRVLQNSTDVSIQDVSIEGNRVVLVCSSNLDGTIEITYAGLGRSGSGNLRDSDMWKSMYNYYDDSADSKKENYTPKDKEGNPIYGKPYPMYNWCSNFYKKITI